VRLSLAALAFALWVSFPASGLAIECENRPDALGWYTPDFVKLQSGGYLGFTTVGVGYATTNDLFNAAVYYGWVPKALAGVEIHSLAYVLSFRGRWCLDERWEWIVGYAGFGAVFTTGDGFFLESPEIYRDDDYYQPTGRRRFLLFGTELLFAPNAKPAWLSAHGAFAELVMLDKYLSAWWKNDRISFRDTLSLALGYKVRF
jgi:hypothetical protein